MLNLFHRSTQEPKELNSEVPLDYWETFETPKVLKLIRDLRGSYANLLEVKIKLERNEESGFAIDKENALAKTAQIERTDEARLQEYHDLIKGLNNLVGEIDFIDAKYDGSEMTIAELLSLAENTAIQKSEQEKNAKKESAE